MSDDTELLRRYAEENVEAAFAELVQRHVNFVYAAALRRVGGDGHLAEDVTQRVFTALARSAATLVDHPVLSGWLYTTTRNVAGQVVRTERRRHAREKETQTMNEITSAPVRDVAWERLRPVLDEAMDELPDADRQAVLLRFFQGKSFTEVGEKLSLSENTARMRVDRALDKLHALLARRGVTSTTTALGIVLANQAAVAAPAGLATSVTGVALAGAASVGGAGAWATFMSIGKSQLGIAGVLVVTGTTGFLLQERTAVELRDELAGLRQQNRALATVDLENTRLTRSASEAERARAQGAELTRLRAESDALRRRLQVAAAARIAQSDEKGKALDPFTGPFFEPSQVDQPSKPVYRAVPAYPADLLKKGVTGQATVDFIVDAQGRVRNVTVVSATDPAIADSAVEAVARWQFEPAQKSGGPVAMHSQEPIVFKISGPTPQNPVDAPAGAKPLSPGFTPWF